jgi:DNA-binding transcriptional MocR family regulator
VEPISFAGAGLSAELLPSDELAACAETVLELDASRILSYGTGGGYSPLRELLGERFGVAPHRVVLTNGWLDGFVLLASRVRGQNVVLEYPTYPAVVQLVLRSGANVLYLDLAPEGPLPDQLGVHLRTNQRPAFVYTIPSGHNPTGQTLSLEQRVSMLQVLHRYQTLGIEDDSYGLLRFDGEPLPTLFELSQGTTIYSSSFSHTIAPGLRVGVFVLPEHHAGPMAARANDNYISPALLSQAMVFEFIQRGSFESHLERLRGELAERCDLMLAALEQHVPDGTWVRPQGGIFVMLALPPGIYAKEALERAEGVTALAGDDFYGRPNTIRLNFAGCGRDEIEPGIERLGAAFALAAAN